MDYMTVRQVAGKWGVSDRRVRLLCAQGRIEGVVRRGRSYLIPINTLKPMDGRMLRGKDIPAHYSALFAPVDAMKAELDRHRPLTRGELERLQSEFVVEYTYNSNAIEGSTLTLKETALALEGVTVNKKPLKDHLEAVGHRDAFMYVTRLVGEKAQLSERVIKEIHSLVLLDKPEDKGVYRRIPVRIMGALHEPPPPYLVPEQMEQLVQDFAHDKKHILESVALFHLRFEGIHPFIDGNGRTGRLLLNLMLMQAGFPPINVKYADRERYYACFDSYHRDNDSSPMVEMLTKYAKERLFQMLQILQG